jgi:hypothetical protein
MPPRNSLVPTFWLVTLLVAQPSLRSWRSTDSDPFQLPPIGPLTEPRTFDVSNEP